jgi:hypothetical protein
LKTIEVEQARTVARLFINQLRTRNFILCFLGADSYGFVHRTFLEYFCAWEFVWQFKESQTLTIEQLINEVFGKHWQDESWHEVLRLICGMIEPKFVAEIINFLLEQKIYIKTININESLEKDYLKEVDRGNYLLQKKSLNSLLLATNCFTEVRNKRLIPAASDKLLIILKNEINQVSEPWFGSNIWFDQESANTFIYLIATIGQEDPDTLPWLKDRTLRDRSAWVRQAAVKAIIQNWQKGPEMFEFLCNICLNDPFTSGYDFGVNPRQTALKGLLKNFSDNPKTLEILNKIALNDSDKQLRYFVVQKLQDLKNTNP